MDGWSATPGGLLGWTNQKDLILDGFKRVNPLFTHEKTAESNLMNWAVFLIALGLQGWVMRQLQEGDGVEQIRKT